MKKMIIMRGLPGSGKSTLAKQIAEENQGVVCSTDDFFMINGVYVFDARLIGKNHSLNLNKVKDLARLGCPCIIVDNTNTQSWEAKKYCEVAVEFGYSVDFKEPTNSWSKDPEECARRNTHGVPLDKIKLMKDRWEPDITLEKCLGSKR